MLDILLHRIASGCWQVRKGFKGGSITAGGGGGITSHRVVHVKPLWPAHGLGFNF